MQAVVLHSESERPSTMGESELGLAPTQERLGQEGQRCILGRRNSPLTFRAVSPAEQADSSLGAGDHYPQLLCLPPASSQNQYHG